MVGIADWRAVGARLEKVETVAAVVALDNLDAVVVALLHVRLILAVAVQRRAARSARVCPDFVEIVADNFDSNVAPTCRRHVLTWLELDSLEGFRQLAVQFVEIFNRQNISRALKLASAFVTSSPLAPGNVGARGQVTSRAGRAPVHLNLGSSRVTIVRDGIALVGSTSAAHLQS